MEGKQVSEHHLVCLPKSQPYEPSPLLCRCLRQLHSRGQYEKKKESNEIRRRTVPDTQVLVGAITRVDTAPVSCVFPPAAAVTSGRRASLPTRNSQPTQRQTEARWSAKAGHARSLRPESRGWGQHQGSLRRRCCAVCQSIAPSTAAR